MTLAFGRVSRLWCLRCQDETLHGVGGICCHCCTQHVPQASTLQPAFNYGSTSKQRPAGGGRPRVSRPDRDKLRKTVDSSGSMAAAARRYGVSEKTVYRWMLAYGLPTRYLRKPKSMALIAGEPVDA